MPIVNILTTAYNSRDYIRDTISSVLNQTFQDWEWIIVDDGSTDDTAGIIKKTGDGRIRYFRQERTGLQRLSYSYNKALSYSRGKIIAMLDHDDLWTRNKLRLQVEAFDEEDVVLSYGECSVIDHKKRQISYMGLPKDPSIANNNPAGAALHELLYNRHNFLATSTVMVRRDTLQDIGGFQHARGLFQDFPTWTRLSIEGNFIAVPHCLGYWRRYPLSSSLNTDPESLFDAGINFLRDFRSLNKDKLLHLGLHFDQDLLGKHWEDLRREFTTYLPYNRAMLMLRLGRFDDARVEFKKFFSQHSTIKNTLIYYSVIASGLIKIDLANPLSTLKSKAMNILKT